MICMGPWVRGGNGLKKRWKDCWTIDTKLCLLKVQNLGSIRTYTNSPVYIRIVFIIRLPRLKCFTDFVFTTPTPDVNFVPVYMCGIDQGSNPYTINERDYTTNVRTTTTIKTIVQNNNDTIKDPAISSLTIYVRA